MTWHAATTIWVSVGQPAVSRVVPGFDNLPVRDNSGLLQCIVHKRAGSFASVGMCVCYCGTLLRVRHNISLCAPVVIRLCGCVVSVLLGAELQHVLVLRV